MLNIYFSPILQWYITIIIKIPDSFPSPKPKNIKIRRIQGMEPTDETKLLSIAGEICIGTTRPCTSSISVVLYRLVICFFFSLHLFYGRVKRMWIISYTCICAKRSFLIWDFIWEFKNCWARSMLHGLELVLIKFNVITSM